MGEDFTEAACEKLVEQLAALKASGVPIILRPTIAHRAPRTAEQPADGACNKPRPDGGK